MRSAGSAARPEAQSEAAAVGRRCWLLPSFEWRAENRQFAGVIWRDAASPGCGTHQILHSVTSRSAIYELEDDGQDLLDFIVEDDPSHPQERQPRRRLKPTPSVAQGKQRDEAGSTGPRLVPHTYTWVSYAGHDDRLLCFVDPGAEQLRVYNPVPSPQGSPNTYICGSRSIPSASRSIKRVSDPVGVR